MTFKFDLTDPKLKQIVEHSFKNKCHLAYSKKLTEASLLIVHDGGVYLMSAALENLRDPARCTPGSPNCAVVVYAEGHGEDTHMGGDDFAENIPAKWFDLAMRGKQHKNAIITLDDKIKFESY